MSIADKRINDQQNIDIILFYQQFWRTQCINATTYNTINSITK